MLHVLADQPFTRRKRFHHIVDRDGKTVASFSTMCQVFDWLYDNDETEITLQTEENLYKLDISTWE